MVTGVGGGEGERSLALTLGVMPSGLAGKLYTRLHLLARRQIPNLSFSASVSLSVKWV